MLVAALYVQTCYRRRPHLHLGDKANRLALASILATDHMMIHRLNRAQIICDVAALYELELVSQEVREDNSVLVREMKKPLLSTGRMVCESNATIHMRHGAGNACCGC